MKLIADLRQKHLEKFQDLVVEYKREHGESFNLRIQNNGAIVRSAISAGWFGDVEGDVNELVGEMSVADVEKYAREVDALFEKFTVIDPN